MADLQRPSQRVAAASRGESESEDEDVHREKNSVDSGEDEGDRGQRSRRTSRQRRYSSNSFKKARESSRQKNRKAFYNADGTATVAAPVLSTSSPRSSRPVIAAPTANASAELDGLDVLTVQEGLATSSQVTDPGQIPFASPVFVMDREARLQSTDFWRLWKQLETTYARSSVMEGVWAVCVCVVAPTCLSVGLSFLRCSLRTAKCWRAGDDLLACHSTDVGDVSCSLLCVCVSVRAVGPSRATLQTSRRSAASLSTLARSASTLWHATRAMAWCRRTFTRSSSALPTLCSCASSC